GSTRCRITSARARWASADRNDSVATNSPELRNESLPEYVPFSPTVIFPVMLHLLSSAFSHGANAIMVRGLLIEYPYAVCPAGRGAGRKPGSKSTKLNVAASFC